MWKWVAIVLLALAGAWGLLALDSLERRVDRAESKIRDMSEVSLRIDSSLDKIARSITEVLRDYGERIRKVEAWRDGK